MPGVTNQDFQELFQCGALNYWSGALVEKKTKKLIIALVNLL